MLNILSKRNPVSILLAIFVVGLIYLANALICIQKKQSFSLGEDL